jgi:hypothetical protein
MAPCVCAPHAQTALNAQQQCTHAPSQAGPFQTVPEMPPSPDTAIAQAAHAQHHSARTHSSGRTHSSSHPPPDTAIAGAATRSEAPQQHTHTQKHSAHTDSSARGAHTRTQSHLPRQVHGPPRQSSGHAPAARHRHRGRSTRTASQRTHTQQWAHTFPDRSIPDRAVDMPPPPATANAGAATRSSEATAAAAAADAAAANVGALVLVCACLQSVAPLWGGVRAVAGRLACWPVCARACVLLFCACVCVDLSCVCGEACAWLACARVCVCVRVCVYVLFACVLLVG